MSVSCPQPNHVAEVQRGQRQDLMPWVENVLAVHDISLVCVCLIEKKTSGHLQEGLDVQPSVADLLHHVIPAPRI